MTEFKVGDRVRTRGFNTLAEAAGVIRKAEPGVCEIRLETQHLVFRSTAEMRHANTPPVKFNLDLPQGKPSLEDQVKALQVGDKVRAVFQYRATRVTVEGLVTTSDHSVMINWDYVLWYEQLHEVNDALVSLEVLEPAKPAPVPFYTNTPAERLPRIGDVGRDGEGIHENGDDRLFAFNGKVWHEANSSYLSRGTEFPPGRLALVHPAELDGEEES